MPTLSLDIPEGGGKASLVPDFQLSASDGVRKFRGWDGVEAEYRNPDRSNLSLPSDWLDYREEWQQTQNAKTSRVCALS